MAANTPMMLRASMVDGRPDLGTLASGQVAGVIDDLPTCAELIERIIDAGRRDPRPPGPAGGVPDAPQPQPQPHASHGLLAGQDRAGHRGRRHRHRVRHRAALRRGGRARSSISDMHERRLGEAADAARPTSRASSRWRSPAT